MLKNCQMSTLARSFPIYLLAVAICTIPAAGQDPTAAPDNQNAPLTERERQLLERVAKLEERVEALEKVLPPSAGSVASTSTPSPAAAPIEIHSKQEAVAETKPATPGLPATFLGGTTLDVGIDGCYSYNFNDPIGRVNLLRAYDVSSNAFSLNQVSLILENRCRRNAGDSVWTCSMARRESTQGNPVNEPRPAIYRNILQAYGSYLLPLGTGLRVDFGKFTSSLGVEGTYTKDQMNYSRSFLFGALPFYHMGARLNSQVNDVVALSYWLANGEQQTEDFNGYKDQF